MVDHSHLRELVEALGSEKIETIMTSFLDETGEAISLIAERLEAQDTADGLIEKIHHTAGSAALVGAEGLRTCLADLETKLASGAACDPSDGRSLGEIWSKTAPELRLYLKSQ